MKKTNSVMLPCLGLVALIWLVMGSPVHAASPVIKDFSSKGGHARNKDNAEDTMYLVKPADKITFKVEANGAEKYEWLVNKAVQKAKGDTFTWTVPNEKSIWEIHLTVSNKDGTSHQEWVVSTLAKSEAPVLFDYFCPDRSQKDPWGRPLPKWDKQIKDPTHMFHGAVITSPKTAYGTWIFQRKCGPKGKRGSFSWRLSGGVGSYYFAKTCAGSESWDVNLQVPSSEGTGTMGVGIHCMGRSVMGECCSHVYNYTDEWLEVRIVRTKDGWFYIWFGDQLWFDSLANENTLKDVSSLRFYGTLIDCVQAYDRPVWPAKSIRFGQYSDDAPPRHRGKTPVKVKRKGIIIDGRGVTLKDIAEAVKNPKIFRYDPATKTATCYTDLAVTTGAELVIDGKTLKMHCNKDGEHQIRVKNCSTIRLNRATVTSDNEFYYLWAFTSPCKNEHYKQWSGYPARSFSGRFLATDSTISNCGNLFIDTPGEMVLKRCRLLDLVEVDIGNYWGGAAKRMAAKGKKGLWFYNRKELVDFRIEDCVITGKDKPIDITFIGGDDLHKATISNCEIDNVAARRGYRFRDWRSVWPPETEQLSCTVSLVNCKFKDLKCQSTKAWIIPKYYLDVLVVDKAGRPLPGCKVRVINEVNDVQYPAENLDEKRYWVRRSVTHNGWIKVWLDVNDLTAAVPAGEDGHTALPGDKANTLVLTDFIRDKDGKQEFTYTVQAIAPDGRFGQVKGINPGPEWYRKDPNKSAHTVKVVLDKAARPAQPIIKPRPAVKTTANPWPTFRGPDHAHTGRSPYVGPTKPHLLWRYKTNGEILNSSAMIGKDGTVYVCSGSPDSSLHAVNPDGNRKWRYRGGFGALTIGPDGTVYVGQSQKILAISPKGKLTREYRLPSGARQCSAVLAPDNTIYCAAANGKEYRLWAIRPDGKAKWGSRGIKGRTNWNSGANTSSPVIAPDGTVFIGGNFFMNAVHAVNSDGTLKWTYKTKGTVLSSPAISVSDKTVYVGDSRGNLLALGFDGSAKWTYKVGGWITSSPAIGSNGTIYFGCRDEYFYAMGKDGKLKWKYRTGDCIDSSAAIDAAGRIYFGSYDHYFYCLDPDGKLIWKYLTGGSVLSSPAIGADGTVYIGSADGYLYAFGK